MDDTETERLDIATAAKRLGLTHGAIHKRISRKQLQAEKIDGRWYIVLPKADSSSPPVQDNVESLYKARLADKDNEIRTLKELLERRDEEVRRVHVLLQQSQQVTLQITSEKKSWWRFWR